MDLTPGTTRALVSRRFDCRFSGHGGDELVISHGGTVVTRIERAGHETVRDSSWLIDNGWQDSVRRLDINLDGIGSGTNEVHFAVRDLGYSGVASNFTWALRGVGDEYYLRGGVALDVGAEERAYTLRRVGTGWSIVVPDEIGQELPERLRIPAKWALIHAGDHIGVGSVILDASPSFFTRLGDDTVHRALDAAAALAVGTGGRSLRLHTSDGVGGAVNLTIGSDFDARPPLAAIAAGLRTRGFSLDGGRGPEAVTLASDADRTTVLITDDVSAAQLASADGPPLLIALIGEQPVPPGIPARARVAIVDEHTSTRQIVQRLLAG